MYVEDGSENGRELLAPSPSGAEEQLLLTRAFTIGALFAVKLFVTSTRYVSFVLLSPQGNKVKNFISIIVAHRKRN